MKIKGKKLTVGQKRILNENGFQNADDYLLLKMKQNDLSASKSLKRGTGKESFLVVIHKGTGEQFEVPM